MLKPFNSGTVLILHEMQVYVKFSFAALPHQRPPFYGGQLTSWERPNLQ
jgi:hypothetical protein